MIPYVNLHLQPLHMSQCTVFVCNDWIRSDQPEVYPSVELLPGLPVPLVLRYRLEVFTADFKVCMVPAEPR